MEMKQNTKPLIWKILDSWPVILLTAYLLMELSSKLSTPLILGIQKLLQTRSPALAASDVWITGRLYLSFIGIWIVFYAFLAINRHDRYIIKMASPRVPGNTIKNGLLGLLSGFAMNGACILTAVLKGDIKLYFNRFDLFPFLFLLIAVFIQCAAEEIAYRGYPYHKIVGVYRKPWLGVLLTALLFSAGHLLNPGVTALALLNIVAVGVLLSLPFLYMRNGIWWSYGFHTAWNFSQSIVFGLPNSGIVFPYSIFKLDAASARSSFAYHVDFGVEGTPLATSLILLTIALWVLYARRKGIKPEVLADL